MSISFEFRKPGKTRADWMSVPPVFIVGCPRSGTTLLRLMLMAHPNISISSEGAYVYTLWPEFAAYGDLSDPSNLRALYQALQPALESEKLLSPPTFDEFLEWVTEFGASLRSIITFYGTWEARVLGKKELIWWGDNAPYHVYNISFFDCLFPDSKFILMIRDPRDACASSKAGFPWHDFDHAVGHWEKSLLDGLAARWNLGPARVKPVRYEELVTEPAKQLQDICGFLGVEYTEEMLTYYQSDAAKMIAQKSHHRNLLKPVFTSSIGKYRQILTQDEIDAIEKRFYAPMRHLGYLSYEEYEERSRK